jgi:hypothetical protein
MDDHPYVGSTSWIINHLLNRHHEWSSRHHGWSSICWIDIMDDDCRFIWLIDWSINWLFDGSMDWSINCVRHQEPTGENSIAIPTSTYHDWIVFDRISWTERKPSMGDDHHLQLHHKYNYFIAHTIILCVHLVCIILFSSGYHVMSYISYDEYCDIVLLIFATIF